MVISHSARLIYFSASPCSTSDERNKNFLFGKHIHDLKKSFTKNSKNSKGRGGKKKESTVLVKSKLVERENPSMESQYLEDIKVKDLNKQI